MWALGGRPGRGDEDRRRPLALPEARAAEPRRVLVPRRLARWPEPLPQLIADPLRAQEPAREVVADVGDDRRPRRRRQQGVERGDAVRLGRRDGEPLRHVVQGPAADPADPRRRGFERRQQQVAPCPSVVTAVRDVAVRRGVPRAAVPARPRRSDLRVERRVDRGPLLGRGCGPDDVEVHRAECTRRGVPDLSASGGRNGGARRRGGARIHPRGGWRAGVSGQSDAVGRGPSPQVRCGPCRRVPAQEPLTPMPHLNRRLRLVVVIASVAVVVANVLVRTPPPRSPVPRPPTPPSTPGSTPSAATPGSPALPSWSSATAPCTRPGSAPPTRAADPSTHGRRSCSGRCPRGSPRSRSPSSPSAA